MSVEDDDVSLKDLVAKTLQSNGVLGKIQAQLRASVFMALDEEVKDKDIPLMSASARQLLASPEGSLAAALVHNFLQCLSLDFTLSVFAPESGHATLWTFPGEEKLSDDLNLAAGDKSRSPLLIELLKKSSNTTTGTNRQDKQRVPNSQLKVNTKASSQPSGHTSLPSLDPERREGLGDALMRRDVSGVYNDDKLMRDKEGDTSLRRDVPQLNNDELMQDRGADKLSSVGGGVDRLRLGGKDETEEAPDSLDSMDSSAGDTASSGNLKHQVNPDTKGGDLDDVKMSAADKQYEDDFSSMSDKDDEEEEIEEAEDIDEDISIDDLINSSASMASEHTKDQSLSQVSDAPNYQEDV